MAPVTCEEEAPHWLPGRRGAAPGLSSPSRPQPCVQGLRSPSCPLHRVLVFQGAGSLLNPQERTQASPLGRGLSVHVGALVLRSRAGAPTCETVGGGDGRPGL